MSGFFKEPVSHWNISNSGGGGGGEISQVILSKHFIELKIFISSLLITYMYS